MFNFCFRFSIHSCDTFTHFFNLFNCHSFTHTLIFTFTIIYLSIYLFIFHSLINLHQVIKVRLHSYIHTYIYTRHSLTKFLLLGNEVSFCLSIVFHSPQLIFNFFCNPLCIPTLEKAHAIKLCHFYDVLMT